MNMESLIYFILGVVLSWIISRHFYRRSNKETPDWFSITNIKEVLTKKPDDIDWTAQQIVNLYNNKIFDFGSGDPLPFSHCPKCGSDKLKRSSFTDEKRDDAYYSIECGECKWSDWTQ